MMRNCRRRLLRLRKGWLDEDPAPVRLAQHASHEAQAHPTVVQHGGRRARPGEALHLEREFDQLGRLRIRPAEA